jgi:hypothetical protein
MVLLLVLSILAFDVSCTQAFLENGNKIKSRTFLSPEFMLGPGSVESKTYDDIDFPRGHIALKSFNAEVVDQAGNPVPLYETYIHHWLVGKYHENRPSQRNFSRNSGLCQGQILVANCQHLQICQPFSNYHDFLLVVVGWHLLGCTWVAAKTLLCCINRNESSAKRE